jgi:hypothetical protein
MVSIDIEVMVVVVIVMVIVVVIVIYFSKAIYIIMVKELFRSIIIQMSPKDTPNLVQACSTWGAFANTLPIDTRNPDFEI